MIAVSILGNESVGIMKLAELSEFLDAVIIFFILLSTIPPRCRTFVIAQYFPYICCICLPLPMHLTAIAFVCHFLCIRVPFDWCWCLQTPGSIWSSFHHERPSDCRPLERTVEERTQTTELQVHCHALLLLLVMVVVVVFLVMVLYRASAQRSRLIPLCVYAMMNVDCTSLYYVIADARASKMSISVSRLT